MKTITCVVFLLSAAMAFAQDKAPELDPDLLAAWKLNVTQADQRVLDAQAALTKTPEFQKYDALRKAAEDIKKSIARTAQLKAPGYTLDLTAWTWKKDPPLEAKQ